LADIPIVSKSQKRLRSPSEGVKVWPRLIKFTTAESTCVPDQFPLSIQPKVAGTSTADYQIRMAGLSITSFY